MAYKKEPSFSLDDFRKWLNNNKSGSIFIFDENKIQKGDKILVRLSKENIVKKLLPLNSQNENINRLCEMLKENGGIVQEIYKTNALINIISSNESVIVPRLFLRRPKTKD